MWSTSTVVVIFGDVEPDQVKKKICSLGEV